MSRLSKQDYLDAAADALAAFGPAGLGLQMRVTKACEHLGISRSTLYRSWPSMMELTEELLVYLANEQPGWHERLVARAPEAPMRDAVEQAVMDHADHAGVVARAVAAGLPSEAALVARVRAAEAGRIGAVSGWLAAHLERHGRAPAPGITAEDLAVVMACVIEGSMLFHHIGQSGLCQPWDQRESAAVGDLVARLVDGLTNPDRSMGSNRGATEAAIERADVPAVAAASHRQKRDHWVLEALGFACSMSLTKPTSPADPIAPSRLVDIGRLARTLGLTERRIYTLWPTVGALNADVVADVSRRHLERAQEYAMEMLASAMAEEQSWNDLYISVVHEIGGRRARSSAAAVFACCFAIADPVVSERMRSENDRWRRAHTIAVLALFQGIGHRLLVDTDVYLDAVFASMFGAERLGRLHPEWLERTVTLDGRSFPLVGTGLGVLFRSLTSLAEDDLVQVEGIEAMAPVIAFLGRSER